MENLQGKKTLQINLKNLFLTFLTTTIALKWKQHQSAENEVLVLKWIKVQDHERAEQVCSSTHCCRGGKIGCTSPVPC